MKKYSNKLVIDYVNGNDIEEDFDVLESDRNFMQMVIDYTNDKKMYSFCSDSLKRNYGFVKYVILKFKNDMRFIIEVADEYLNNADNNEIEETELNILMSEILPEYSDDGIVYDAKIKYGLKKTAFYVTESSFVEGILMEEKDNLLERGFVYFVDKYGATSDITLKYIASEYINKIISDVKEENDNINLEQLFHKDRRNYKVVSECGVVNFIITCFRKYDSYLATYLTTHLDLISSLVNEVNRIYNNWDKYNDNLNKERVETFQYEIEKYLSIPMKDMNFSCIQLEAYVIKLLHLEETFNNYYNSMSLENSQFNPIKMLDYFEIDLSKISLMEYKCLKYAIALAKEIFDTDYLLKSDYSDVIEEKISGKSLNALLKIRKVGR